MWEHFLEDMQAVSSTLLLTSNSAAFDAKLSEQRHFILFYF